MKRVLMPAAKVQAARKLRRGWGDADQFLLNYRRTQHEYEYNRKPRRGWTVQLPAATVAPSWGAHRRPRRPDSWVWVPKRERGSGSRDPLDALRTATVKGELEPADPRACIRHLCDVATGQPPGGARQYLELVLDYAPELPGLRDMIAAEYPLLLDSFDWVSGHDIYGYPLKPSQGSGHNWELTDEERKLVTDHLPLVTAEAVKRASTITNLAGGTVLDEELLSELEAIGLQVLEDQIRRWDRTRGVTFGAFVRKYVAGAMDNFFRDNPDRTRRASSNDAAREMWKSEAHGRRTKQNRRSTGARMAKTYVESAVRHSGWRIKANPTTGLREDLDCAKAQLTRNQRVVYEGRVESEPQRTRGALAKELGVSEPRITFLEKKARHRMTDLLTKRGT
jgi:DNA-directed RNA polymerase specialized sigma subunit